MKSFKLLYVDEKNEITWAIKKYLLKPLILQYLLLNLSHSIT